jgi:hypothetical protein
MERQRIPAILAAVSLALLITVPVLSCTPVPAQQATQVSQPVLVCSPDQVDFKAVYGQMTAMEQVINITNQGGGLLAWTISDNVRWIDEKQLANSSGSQAGTIKVVVDPSGMASGEYTGIITIDAEGAQGSPFHVPVFLTITSTEANATATAVPQASSSPSDAAVVWKNQTELSRYASVNSCIVSGSITNTDRWWYLSNVTIKASSGEALIATRIPPGETVIYYRRIPCYQREDVKLVYTWYQP